MINSLSIIFPVFNEQNRINNSLNKLKKFIFISKIEFLEIIFIDDGSKDKTYFIIQNFIERFKFNKNINIYLLKNIKNFGKGYSLKKGVAYSKAEWILTVDIDLSVDLNQLDQWNKNKLLNNNCFIYFGSRIHKNSKVKKSILRYLLGLLFRILIYFLFRIKINDTQCGYKLYKNLVAKKIFSKLKDYRYAHDIEIVLIANLMKIVIKELPVKWIHRSNSKLNIFIDPLIMFWHLLLIKKRFLNRI